MGAALALQDPVDYEYESPPEKRHPVSARVPTSVLSGLMSVVRLWKLQAKMRKDDPALVDRSYVVERLLKTGIDGVWSRMAASTGFDQIPPETDAEWAALEKILERAHAANSKR